VSFTGRAAPAAPRDPPGGVWSGADEPPRTRESVGARVPAQAAWNPYPRPQISPRARLL